MNIYHIYIKYGNQKVNKYVIIDNAKGQILNSDLFDLSCLLENKTLSFAVGSSMISQLKKFPEIFIDTDYDIISLNWRAKFSSITTDNMVLIPFSSKALIALIKVEIDEIKNLTRLLIFDKFFID